MAGVQIRAQLPPGVDGWGYSLKGMMGMVVFGGLLVAGAYFYLNRTVVKRLTALQPKKKKVVLSSEAQPGLRGRDGTGVSTWLSALGCFCSLMVLLGKGAGEESSDVMSVAVLFMYQSAVGKFILWG